MLSQEKKSVREFMTSAIMNEILKISSIVTKFIVEGKISKEEEALYRQDLDEYIATCYEFKENEEVNFSINLILDKLPFNRYVKIVLDLRESGFWKIETLPDFSVEVKKEFASLVLSGKLLRDQIN